MGEFAIDDMSETGLFGMAGDAKAESNSKEFGVSRLAGVQYISLQTQSGQGS